jgi:hypothetical protein
MLKIEAVRSKRTIRDILIDHFALRVFKGIAINQKTKADVAEFSRDGDFWSAVLKRSLLPGRSIQLTGFHVLEWFPRTPGLYHLPKSKLQRATALEFVDSILSKELDEDHRYTIRRLVFRTFTSMFPNCIENIFKLKRAID